MPHNPAVPVYKITTAELWNASQEAGHLVPMPIDVTDGYLHFSTADQLRDTLHLHFAGCPDLMLLSVSPAFGDWRWEPSRRGQLFPHLYGPLPLSAVVKTAPIAVRPDGSADLPWGL